MGLDSLMGVELVVALESRFSIKLPVMALSENPTINKLAERIIEQLRNSEEQGGGGPTYGKPVHEHIQQVASQHAVDASAESINRLAEDMQAGGDKAPTRIIH
jgi:hypothetical protein